MFIPDSAHVTSTTFSSTLIKDDWELHLISRLELNAILHLFYMEEQLFALTHFVCDETKLEATKENFRISSTIFQGPSQTEAVESKWYVMQLKTNELHLVFNTLHWSSSLRDDITGHLLTSLGDGANL